MLSLSDWTTCDLTSCQQVGNAEDYNELLFLSFAHAMPPKVLRGLPKNPYSENCEKSPGFSRRNARCQRPKNESRFSRFCTRLITPRPPEPYIKYSRHCNMTPCTEMLHTAGVAERTNAAGSRPVVPLEHLGSNPNPGVTQTPYRHGLEIEVFSREFLIVSLRDTNIFRGK